MKLLYQTHSPHARKVLVMAHEVGIADRLEVIHQETSPMVRNDAVFALNPLGKVPVLILSDVDCLFDSMVICEYLDSLPGGPKLFPAEGERRWSALRVQAMANGILDAAVLTRYETAVRPAQLRWDAWTQGQLLKVDQALDVLEREAAKFDGLDIGTIAVGCALGYLDFRYADRNWRATRPQLARWYELIARRPSFEKTVPKA